MKTDFLKREDWPDRLKEILRRAGYKKHSVGVTVTNLFTFSQPYWSGGSKDEHLMLDSVSGKVEGIYVRKATAWPAIPATDTIEIPYGRIAVLGGIFCGKPATWFLHMTEATARDLGLPLPTNP